MQSHRYRVAGAVASAVDIDDAVVADAPKLTILAANSVKSAACEATAIKRLWPKTKIILLFEQASAEDLDDMLTSQFDACMPFHVSLDAFVGTLERIQETGLRIFLTAASIGNAPAGDTPDASQGETPQIPSNKKVCSSTSSSGIHELSDREQQILKDLAKGHSNKMIARTCSLAEATVKVHLKSILRKTRLTNRTQAAIWALENGYAGAEEDDAL
jgi:two-component system nitrate/nitrite response regulator NarL